MNIRLSLAALVLVAGPVLADDAALLLCRQIGEPVPRLACYDAVVIAPRAPSQTLPQRAAAAFGLTGKSVEVDPGSVESTVVGEFEGWSPNGKIRLANGQVWQVIDGSNAAVYLKAPKVVVRRGALGGYVMEIAGTNRSPRVQRTE